MSYRCHLTPFTKYSYCAEISKEQEQTLFDILKENHTWRYTNTCASFASETFYDVTGIDIDADDNFGFETPREISESIEELNHKSKSSSNSGGSSW